MMLTQAQPDADGAGAHSTDVDQLPQRGDGAGELRIILDWLPPAGVRGELAGALAREG